jgi:hypothetical protein
MATKKSIKTNRTTLVDGCGTILKVNRLRGGYQLVKRKRVKSDTPTATAPAKRRGRPAKAKSVAPVMAMAKRRGRPAKAKVVITEEVVMTAPAKRRGRPAKAKSVAPVMATAKRRGRKASTTAKVMKPSAKATTRKASKRGRRKSVKA